MNPCWVPSVEHLGEATKTSLWAGRQGQEGDEGAQTLTEIILGTGTKSRGQWQELGFNRSPCVSTLIGQEKLPVVQQSNLASGHSSLPLDLPPLKAAVHAPIPSLSFPLILHRLFEPDEVKNWHYLTFP